MVEHQALGGVNLGYHSGPAGHDPQAQQVLLGEMVEMFRRAGVDSSPMPSPAQARWMKLVWNVPFNGLSALLDAGTESLLASDDTRAQIKAIMQEVCAAAQALGCALPEDFPEKLLMGTARMPDYLPSMYHDRLHNRPMELEAIYAAPLAAAAQAGHIDAPYRNDLSPVALPRSSVTAPDTNAGPVFAALLSSTAVAASQTKGRTAKARRNIYHPLAHRS